MAVASQYAKSVVVQVYPAGLVRAYARELCKANHIIFVDVTFFVERTSK
jgi:hypothetical protein